MSEEEKLSVVSQFLQILSGSQAHKQVRFFNIRGLLTYWVKFGFLAPVSNPQHLLNPLPPLVFVEFLTAKIEICSQLEAAKFIWFQSVPHLPDARLVGRFTICS